MQLPGFIGPSYTLTSPVATVQRTVNLYPVLLEQEDAARILLYGTPGLSVLGTLPDRPHRGAFYQDGRAFMVAGGGFFEIWPDWSATWRGAVANDGTPATMVSNGVGGNQLMIVSGGSGYTFNLQTNTFATITDPQFPSRALMGGYIDGYGLVLSGTSNTFQISSLMDFSAWDGADVGTRNQQSDNILALLTDHPLVSLLGSKTSELWYDNGAAAFPFAPVPGSFIKHGIAAAFSADVADNAPHWLAQNDDGRGYVVRGQGGSQVARISTDAVERAIQRYSRIDDAEAFSYSEEGETFYVLTFPTADATWVYGVKAQQWHERGEWDTATGVYHRHRARTHMLAFGTHVVGDYETGQFYRQSLDLYDDAGTPKRWLRRSPHLLSGRKALIVHRLELEMETGIGLTLGQGVSPEVMLRLSDDGGRTFGAYRTGSIGALGQYTTRVFWTRLGLARDRVIEVSGSDPVKTVLLGAEIEATGGAA